MSDPASYKQLKEDFVSNLAGGDVTEINLVTAVAPVAVLLWSVLQSRHAFFTPYTPLALVVDFLLNSAAILLALTLYASRPIVLNLLLLAPAVVLLAASPRPPRPSRPSPPVGDSATPRAAALPARPFLTTYRGAMMVVTCAAILAVDFRLFPRRFAKVETWGTSLMDVGVGSFVFSAGLVGARPVLKAQAEAERAGRGAAAASLPRRVLHSLRHSLPLLALGVIRLMSVKSLDYAEHVTEYGVHWNFFFTLACLPPCVAVLQSARRLVPSHATLAVTLSGLYEVALATTPLARFILTAPRTGLLSMNREGIFSFIGYLAIYLAGQDAGMFVMPRSAGPRRRGMDGRGRGRGGTAPLLKRLAAWSALWTGLYLVSTHYRYGFGLTVSRRLANLPYVLWVAAFNVSQITAFCLIDALLFPERGGGEDEQSARDAHDRATSPILRAFNRNGLFVFLVANLLTGLVNLTVPTLDAGPPAAMGILVLYMAALTGVAVGLDYFDISIKM